MKRIKALVVFFLLLASAGCSGIINSLSFFPDKGHIMKSGRLPAHVTEKFIDTPDGIKLQLLYFRHEKGSGKVVVYFHGNAGNLYGRIDEGDRIFSMGHDVVISGYRGYGRSSGEPTEEGVYIDGRTVCDYVIRVLGYPEERVYIYGRSIGTTVAVEVSMDKGYGGVILVTPLTSAEDFIRAKYPGWMAGIGAGHFESEKKISRLKSPILVIHGTSDEIIPYDLGLKLFNAYAGEKKLITVNGGRHNDLEYTDPGVFWPAIENFIAGKNTN